MVFIELREKIWSINNILSKFDKNYKIYLLYLKNIKFLSKNFFLYKQIRHICSIFASNLLPLLLPSKH